MSKQGVVSSCLLLAFCSFISSLVQQGCEKVADFSDLSIHALWAPRPGDHTYLLGIYRVPGILPPRTRSLLKWAERSGVDPNTLRNEWHRRMGELLCPLQTLSLSLSQTGRSLGFIQVSMEGPGLCFSRGSWQLCVHWHRGQTLEGRRGQEPPEAHRLFLAARRKPF